MSQKTYISLRIPTEKTHSQIFSASVCATEKRARGVTPLDPPPAAKAAGLSGSQDPDNKLSPSFGDPLATGAPLPVRKILRTS